MWRKGFCLTLITEPTISIAISLHSSKPVKLDAKNYGVFYLKFDAEFNELSPSFRKQLEGAKNPSI